MKRAGQSGSLDRTPLRSASRRSLSDADREYHSRIDPHRHGSHLADLILGGQDGLVNVLGVVLGVAAATASRRLVLVAGLAAAFAESISMAAVAFTATLAQADLYKSEREREARHIRRVPALEIQEIRDLFERKGLKGEALERVVEAITANEEAWIATMMAEEHRLVPSDTRQALRAALVVGVAALFGSLLPLVPFVLFPVRQGAWISIATGALVLFALGAYKARVTVGNPIRSGLMMTAIGTASALAGYGIGLLLRVPVLG